MKTKKILADSMPQALRMVRQQLGDNAIIVNTRTVKKGGVFGLFAKQKYEVTAYAVDIDSPFPEPAPRQSPPQEPARRMEPAPRYTAPQEPATGMDPALKQLRNEPAFTVDIKQSSLAGKNYSQGAGRAMEIPEASKKPEPAIHEPSPLKGDAGNHPSAETGQNDNQLLEELKDMRKMMMTFMLNSKQESPLPSELSVWVARLKKQGADDEVVEHIAGQLLKKQESLNNQESIKQELSAIVKEIIQKRIPETNAIGRETKLINVVGPTGVGKTTTIAKLATEQVLRQKRRVGMITTDVYRIGAVEQLKTYAGILNVPIEVVRSADELDAALVNLKHADLIYMDTTGRNYREMINREAINPYLNYPKESESFLVLSLTTKFEDMEILLKEFLDSPIKKLILTKFDETASYGSILNIAYKFPYQLAYFTNGQSVPEDISPIDADMVTRHLLGDEMENGSGTESKRIYGSL